MNFTAKIVSAVFFASMTVSFVIQATSQSDQQWILQNFWPVLEELLPVKEHPGMWVAYRSSKDSDRETLEYMFMLTDTGQLDAVVRIADGKSIQDQLWALHKEKPEATGKDLQPQIKIQKFSLDERSCPAIKRQWESVPNILHRLPTRDKGMFHPTNHELFVAFGMGRAEFSIFESDHPLVLWALETRAVLEACIESVE